MPARVDMHQERILAWRRLLRSRVMQHLTKEELERDYRPLELSEMIQKGDLFSLREANDLSGFYWSALNVGKPMRPSDVGYYWRKKG